MKQQKNPLASVVLRVIVAGYLIYLGYQILTAEDATTGPKLAAVLFIVCGAAFGIWAVASFVKADRENSEDEGDDAGDSERKDL